MNHDFYVTMDFGILGEQEIEVSYEADGYKPLDFEVWMHNFPYVGKSTDVTDFLTDAASNEIYDICRQHRIEYMNGGEP